MRCIVAGLMMVVLFMVLASFTSAETSSASIEKRKEEIGCIIKGCVDEKDIRPEATVQLQGSSASTLAQPTVSTLAQPHEDLTRPNVLNIIKTAKDIVFPDD
jgi:hypothetical protein